jgi:hypothetical protein
VPQKPHQEQTIITKIDRATNENENENEKKKKKKRKKKPKTTRKTTFKRSTDVRCES